MKRMSVACGVIAVASVLAAACGGNQEKHSDTGMSMPAPAPQAAAGASTSAQNAEITFKSEPDPPRTGDNTFEVMVMSGGQPVTDADVSVELFMAAMPSMKMPEMRNSVSLKHEAGGRYRGAGNVMMAGNWDATVRVKRGEQEIGSRKFSVAAK
jgi:hypothetical protein